MIIERRLSKWESRNFTRVRKLSPKETQKFYSQLYEQREYAMGLGFLSKGLGKIGSGFSSFGKSASNLNTKIGEAGGTGQVFKNIGSNIKTGFENTGTRIKNWWNSGPSAYETTGMYQKRIGKGVDPNVKPTQEYKSIFTPKKQPETFYSPGSANAETPFAQKPNPEPQNIVNPVSGSATNTGAGGSIFTTSGLQNAVKKGGSYGGYDLATGKPLGPIMP